MSWSGTRLKFSANPAITTAQRMMFMVSPTCLPTDSDLLSSFGPGYVPNMVQLRHPRHLASIFTPSLGTSGICLTMLSDFACYTTGHSEPPCDACGTFVVYLTCHHAARPCILRIGRPATPDLCAMRCGTSVVCMAVTRGSACPVCCSIEEVQTSDSRCLPSTGLSVSRLTRSSVHDTLPCLEAARYVANSARR